MIEICDIHSGDVSQASLEKEEDEDEEEEKEWTRGSVQALEPKTFLDESACISSFFQSQLSRKLDVHSSRP